MCACRVCFLILGLIADIYKISTPRIRMRGDFVFDSADCVKLLCLYFWIWRWIVAKKSVTLRNSKYK